MDYQELPRVLIIGTVPYNRNTTSRAFDAYFHNWPKEKLAQIFSMNKKPTKGHCKFFFQITDQRLLKRRFHKNIKTGISYLDDELEDEWKDNQLETDGNKFFNFLYRSGKKKTSFKYLMRKWLWKKKYWYTKELNDWLVAFRPQVIFLSFSDDFFIPEMALYIARKFNIPIVSSTGDDYIFNHHFSLSPFYPIYRHQYKKLISKIMSYPGDIIYIGDKIRNKYNEYYHRAGQTIYLSSEMERVETLIERSIPVFSYFGNIRNGRNEALLDIACALQKINKDFKIHVYSSEKDNKYMKKLKKHPGIIYCGNIPYSEVVQKTKESNFLIVVEGTKKKDIINTRYSLSTKAADCLASGIPTIAYGSKDCGVIEYLASTNAVCVIDKKEDLVYKLTEYIENHDLQNSYLLKAREITEQNHRLEKSNAQFESIVMNAYHTYRDKPMAKDISMIIQSCDLFSDIWDAHVSLLEMNFGDRQMETFLVSDKKNSMEFEHVQTLFAGEKAEYSERLSYALEHIKTKYVLLTLDDYFLTKKIDIQRIHELVEIMDKEDMAYLRLFKIPKGKKKTKYEKIHSLTPIEQYDVNLYPGIWRVDALKTMITEVQNAWQFEVSLTKKAVNSQFTYFMTKEKVYPILDGVRKGKLLFRSNFFLKHNQLYFGKRKRIDFLSVFKIKMMDFAKKILPKKWARKIKDHLKKKGVHFYSE